MTFPKTTVEGDTVPEALEVRILVEVIEDYSVHSPARLNIRVINDAAVQRRFYFGYVAPFNPMKNDLPEEKTLCIIPDNTSDEHVSRQYSELIPAAPDGDCWRLNEQYVVPLSQRVVTTPPGGEVSNTYSILNVPNKEECLPTGTYRFESDWGLRDPDMESEQRHSWGFRLELST